jgi:ribonucleoside-diphosphate reductase alpha chain
MTTIDNNYENFIAVSRYARWLDKENRRETWGESVDRYVNFMVDHLKKNYDVSPEPALVEEIRANIFSRNVMPSMRALMTAGPALARDNVAGFNCSFLPVNSPRSFDEAMYILMCGTGVGFSVESKYVNELPTVNEHFEDSKTTIVVEDSKSGWARAFRELLALLWQGQIPTWDVSKVRPRGARLKTFGGRASGPEPLVDLFEFAIKIFKNAAGRQLKPIEAHDLMCKVGDIVVVGGVRRSALISLSDLEDFDMAKSKSGAWWESQEQRRLANNSAVYNTKPSIGQFLREWGFLYESNSGERGIFNKEGIQHHASSNGRRDGSRAAGTNPCGEIILRDYQFCNLTEVVIRPEDNEETLARKVELASILGTWQSSLTNFRYIRKIWKDNSEEERLLGVSLTGQFGNTLTSGKQGADKLVSALESWKSKAISANVEWAGILGIQESAAITTVKPSGTVSQLTGVSSGMHPWHSSHYLRTVRCDSKDAIADFLKDAGVYWEIDAMSPETGLVFYFPIKAPQDAVVRDELTAIQHLEMWKIYKQHWTEHNPSITVSVREHEWIDVAAWVYDNWEAVGGIAFLPYSDHVYKQAPYTPITAEEFEEWDAKSPKSIDWAALSFYETEDGTTGSQDLACIAGECDIVDVKSAIIA